MLRFAQCIGRGALVLAWCVLLAYVVGMVMNDRARWSQFLWWIPTPVAACAALALLLVRRWMFAACTRGRNHRQATIGEDAARSEHAPAQPRPLPSACIRALGPRLPDRIAMLATIALVLIFAVYEVRCYRVFARAPQVADDTIRVVTWNVSVTKLPDLPGHVRTLAPDVLLLANPPFQQSLVPTREAMGETTFAASYGRLTILSKFPVLYFLSTDLDVTGAHPRVFRWQGGGMVSIDRGQALLAVLDTTSWRGKPTCVWLLDMPSDPPIERATMMRQARRTLESCAGHAYTRTQDGLDKPLVLTQEQKDALLAPDIVAGDFNTTKNSWSLTQLLGPRMRHAADDAGAGWRRTWPAPLRLIAIDHTFLGPQLACRAYGVVNTGVQLHDAQVAVVGVRGVREVGETRGATPPGEEAARAPK